MPNRVYVREGNRKDVGQQDMTVSLMHRGRPLPANLPGEATGSGEGVGLASRHEGWQVHCAVQGGGRVAETPGEVAGIYHVDCSLWVWSRAHTQTQAHAEPTLQLQCRAGHLSLLCVHGVHTAWRTL